MRTEALISMFIGATFGLLILAACGDDVHLDFSADIKQPKEEAEPTPTPGPFDNPICKGDMPFKNGTLWKPQASEDSWIPGKLVVLIDPSFTKEFDFCFAELKDGQGVDKIVSLQYFGKSNGDRQTWRAYQEGKEFIDNGYIRCTEESQSCKWTFEGSSAQRHE